MLEQDDLIINIRTGQKVTMLKKTVKIICAVLLFGIVLLFFIVLLEQE
jgi:hypothetical protein